MHPQQRIKVTRIIARLNVGGPAIHAALLTNRLDPARYECRLLTGQEEQSEGSYLQLHNETVNHLEVVPRLGREIQGAADIKALWALVHHMRKFKPHIVHTHTAKAGALGRIAARLTHVPIIVHTFHGHVLHGYFSKTKTNIFLGIERWLSRYTDTLLAVSSQVRHDLLRLGIGPPERLKVLPLGLELQPFLTCETQCGSLRRELKLESQTMLIGIVARLVPIKKHEIFLSAAALILRDYPDTHFIVVGDGERRQELEALARDLHIADHVHFLGWRGDLSRIYADLDIVALTSANEGLPVSLIEGMAAGKPVVATRVGGVPDLVAENTAGLLVPADNAFMFSQAVSILIGDSKKRLAMGRFGREKVFPAYSSERLISDIGNLYEELVSRKLGRSL